MRKSWGQHFLHEKSVVDRIVSELSIETGQQFIEIGPGRGVMTEQLLSRGARVHAIEIDPMLTEQLHNKLGAHKNLSLCCADALKLEYQNIQQAISSPQKPVRIVANLPYNIATALLLRMLAWKPEPLDLHLMLQREVAMRLCASTGSKHYGRLSVVTQVLCDTAVRVMDVRAGAFTPPPKVRSELVRLVPKRNMPSPTEQRALAQLTRTAFSARRKMIKHSLGKLFTEKTLVQFGLDLKQRPQELSAAQYLSLSRLLKSA